MTIVGIAGASALIIMGLGIRQSISEIMSLQFGGIAKYDGMMIYNPNQKFTPKHQDIKSALDVRLESLQLKNPDGYTIDKLSAIIAKDGEDFNKYLTLDKSPTDDGVVITSKIARIYHVEAGDFLTLYRNDGVVAAKVKVLGVTRNYVAHYIYLTKTYYEKVWGEDLTDNTYLIKLKGGINVDEFYQKSLADKAIVQVVRTDKFKKIFDKMLAGMDGLIFVIIAVSGLLGFVVLYTLTNTNVAERIRELSTLKVLGFYPNEVLGYIFRETFLLTLVGIFFGIFLGISLHDYIMSILLPNIVQSPLGVSLENIVISTILTLLFALIVRSLMRRKINHVDMLESLKSVN
jgi:putative ABC transport system permease protein